MIFLNKVANRDSIPIYTKTKEKPAGSHLVNSKTEKEYDYYKCDYCDAEIKILNKRFEMTGGVVTLSRAITKKREMKLALCNKCLKPVLMEIEKRSNVK